MPETARQRRRPLHHRVPPLAAQAIFNAGVSQQAVSREGHDETPLVALLVIGGALVVGFGVLCATELARVIQGGCP